MVAALCIASLAMVSQYEYLDFLSWSFGLLKVETCIQRTAGASGCWIPRIFEPFNHHLLVLRESFFLGMIVAGTFGLLASMRKPRWPGLCIILASAIVVAVFGTVQP